MGIAMLPLFSALLPRMVKSGSNGEHGTHLLPSLELAEIPGAGIWEA